MLDPYISTLVHFRHNFNGKGLPTRRATNTYELIRLLGSFYSVPDSADPSKEVNCFVAIGRLQTPQLLKELRMSSFSCGKYFGVLVKLNVVLSLLSL